MSRPMLHVACYMMYVCMMYDVWRVLSRTACSLQDVKKGKPRFYGLDPIFNYGNVPSPLCRDADAAVVPILERPS